MRIIYTLLLTMGLTLLGPPSQAQQSDHKSVITAQIQAFERDDFADAFAHASPMIQRIFGTPANFGNMVKNGFPMVWRPANVQFLGTQSHNGEIRQDVMIRDAQGRLHILEYDLIRSEMGWKINGVRIKAPAPATA